MTKKELRHRLKAVGYPIDPRDFARLVSHALNQPQKGRPAGAPGHRKYSERDYRRVVAWLRVHELCGADREPVGIRVRREATELLALNTQGYVWISNSQVGWSALPPVGILRQNGVATCWPGQE